MARMLRPVLALAVLAVQASALPPDGHPKELPKLLRRLSRILRGLGRAGGVPLANAGKATSVGGAELGDNYTGSPAAVDCLRKTTPSLEVSYPDDAEEHFEELQAFFAPWRERVSPHCAAGYCGPWIENGWISHFEGLSSRSRSGGAKLHQIFGPYIPLFFPWTDVWVGHGFHYPANFVSQLQAKLRPDVAYIAVSQNDEGLTGKCELLMSSIPNVLVLSAGGYGHVAVPLLKQVEPLNDAKSMAARQYQASYMGSLTHAPGDLRQRMADIVSDTSGGPGAAPDGSENPVFFRSRVRRSAKLPGVRHYVGYGSDWKAVMADSRVSLCPRGFGRTSYHLMETLQMGLIPLHVYSDVPWVPYPELFERVGFATDLAGLPAVLERVNGMGATEFEQMERRIKGLKATHFTMEGTMEQIGRFMTARDGGGDLRCRPLPPDVRGAGPCG